jgi:bacterioferritin-associated ferredoxin
LLFLAKLKNPESKSPSETNLAGLSSKSGVISMRIVRIHIREHTMYVCLCNKVTDRQIRDAARRGCCRLDDLRVELGVATCCGACAETAEGLLDERQQNNAPGPFALPQPA